MESNNKRKGHTMNSYSIANSNSTYNQQSSQYSQAIFNQIRTKTHPLASLKSIKDSTSTSNNNSNDNKSRSVSYNDDDQTVHHRDYNWTSIWNSVTHINRIKTCVKQCYPFKSHPKSYKMHTVCVVKDKRYGK